MGSKKRKRNRELMKKELDKLKEENMSLKRRMKKYKQKYFRVVSKKDDTPKKDVKKMLSGKKVPEIIHHTPVCVLLSHLSKKLSYLWTRCHICGPDCHVRGPDFFLGLKNLKYLHV